MKNVRENNMCIRVHSFGRLAIKIEHSELFLCTYSIQLLWAKISHLTKLSRDKKNFFIIKWYIINQQESTKMVEWISWINTNSEVIYITGEIVTNDVKLLDYKEQFPDELMSSISSRHIVQQSWSLITITTTTQLLEQDSSPMFGKFYQES